MQPFQNSRSIEQSIILTENYLILCGQDIFPYYMIKEFGLYNCEEFPFAQYALDRISCPYDPDYASEYEDEETYELDRFKVRLILKDMDHAIYDYSCLLEVADRSAFCTLFAEKSMADELSASDVKNGAFPDEMEGSKIPPILM